MNAPEALHTAARRYCLERRVYWCERYSEISRQGRDRQSDGYDYTPEALATFPRYNVLNAIRVELERIALPGLATLEDARALLVAAGAAAKDDFTRNPIGEIDQRAMAEEREAFCRFVGGLKPSDLDAVAALPYRRVLSTDESKSVWSALRARWQIPEGYWYPLTDCTAPDVVAFDAAAFAEAAPPRRLQEILAARGIERVWELREYGPEYEQDVSLFEPLYNGAEGYWSSQALDWVVYASHEGSVTVAGWLLHELKKTCPWEAIVWTPGCGKVT
jgi:hypothetical protein